MVGRNGWGATIAQEGSTLSSVFEATSVGTMRFDFNDANKGVMRYAAAAMSDTKAVMRQLFGP